MAVYWIGTDGNVWLDGKNQGELVKDYGNGYEAQFSSGVGTRIDDPNPGGVNNNNNTSAPRGSGGGGAAPAPKRLNDIGVRNTQRAIDQIPDILRAALAANKTSYGNTVRQFQEQEAVQRKAYDGSTVTNQQNYDANFMDSIRAGIKGLGGLMNVLRGTGATGGTAEDIARETVGGVTAQDIRGGADVQKENQSALDTSLSAFLTELSRKRALNEDAFENNERAARRESDTQLQELFGKMAGYYGEVDDRANANSWADRAGDLTPRIARNSQAQVSRYDKAPIQVKAPELTAFSGPTEPSVVTAPDGQIGSGIFTMSEPRRRREALSAGA